MLATNTHKQNKKKKCKRYNPTLTSRGVSSSTEASAPTQKHTISCHALHTRTHHRTYLTHVTAHLHTTARSAPISDLLWMGYVLLVPYLWPPNYSNEVMDAALWRSMCGNVVLTTPSPLLPIRTPLPRAPIYDILCSN